MCVEGEVGMLNSEWEGPGWEIRATSQVAKARGKEARYNVYTAPFYQLIPPLVSEVIGNCRN